MKRGRLFLGVSLGLNVISVGLLVVLLREKGRGTETPVLNTAGGREESVGAQAAPTTTPGDVSAARPEAWRALHSDDLKTFAANLRAAGLSDPLVRAIVRAEIDDRYRAREAVLAPRRPTVGYWQFDDYKEPLETKLARMDLRREKARELLDVLGADPEQQDVGGIPTEKRELAQMIAEDYDALIGEIVQDQFTILLPSERKMLQQLEGEKHRELEELLSRQELTEYIVRNSRTGDYLRRQLRGLQPTEAEFRAIFEAQNEFDAMMKMTRFDGWSPARAEAHADARKKMESEIKSALGDDRYRSYVRERNPELQGLRDLADRVGASRHAAERVYDLRELVTRESKRIGDDYTQSVDARKAAIAALAQQVRGEIQSSLGTEAAEAYLQRASAWLTSLEQGHVVELGEGSISSHSVQAAPAPHPNRP